MSAATIAPRIAPPQSSATTPRPSRPAAAAQHGGRLGHEISFTDIYFRLDAPPTNAFYLPRRGKADPPDMHLGGRPIPAFLFDEVVELQEAVRARMKPGRRDGSVIHQGMRMRFRLAHTVGDEKWTCLRPIDPQPWPLGKLGADPIAIRELASLGHRKGLTLIVGATGEGKTTTAASLFNHWLETSGLLGFTVEDPVEFDFRNPDPNAIPRCFQVEIDDETGWTQGLEAALRFHPRYIFLGEVRTASAAAMLLQIATSGHPCIATIHGGSVKEGITRMQLLAAQELGDRVYGDLAGCLSGIGHQVMTRQGKPHLNLLITEDGNEGCPFRSAIRTNNLASLGTWLDQLEIRLFGRRRNLDEHGRPVTEDGLDALRKRAGEQFRLGKPGG